MRSWYNIFVVIVLILLGLWLWRRTQAEPTAPTNEDTVLESRVNEFLDNAGFSLPEDIDRANLDGTLEGDSTGVATRSQIDDATEYTVLASLPDLISGWYQAWLTTEDGQDPVSLGQLIIAKGGYVVETTTQTDWSQRGRVIVTHEETLDDQPETTILEGLY
jgi:hypothetical protein